MKIFLTAFILAGTASCGHAFSNPSLKSSLSRSRSIVAASDAGDFNYGAILGDDDDDEAENPAAEAAPEAPAEEAPKAKSSSMPIPQLSKEEVKRLAPFAYFDPDAGVYNGPNLAYANEPGVVAPLGLFDPFSLLDTADRDRFDRLRGVELKHGRASMLAVVGYLTTYAGYRLPGLEDVPGGLAALDNLPNDVVGQIWMTFFVMEIANRDQTGEAAFPGDFRNGVLDFGWDDQPADWQRSKRTIELQNGRAAMMGILALMVHDAMGNVADILPGGGGGN